MPQRSSRAQAVLAAKLLILYSVEHFILLSYMMGKYIILFFPKKHKKRSTTLHLWCECVFPGTCLVSLKVRRGPPWGVGGGQLIPGLPYHTVKPVGGHQPCFPPYSPPLFCFSSLFRPQTGFFPPSPFWSVLLLSLPGLG